MPITPGKKDLIDKLLNDYLNAKEYLTSWAMNPVDDPTLPGLGMTKPPDDDDLQRAWFAYFNEMDASEVLRRLEGK